MKYIEVIKQDGIAIVTFDRHERLNAFDQLLIKELTDVGRGFVDDLETQVVIVTGGSSYFSSGADLKDGTSRDDKLLPLEQRHLFGAGGRLCDVWEGLDQVTIAAISGLAVGAGIAFALALDFRVMERDAYCFVPEVRLGTTLQWNTLPRLVALVGPARAKRIALLCERFCAEDLYQWGVVDVLCEPRAAVEKAQEWGRILAGYDPVAVRMVKRATSIAAGALTRGLSFADSDQSMLTALINNDRWAMPAKE